MCAAKEKGAADVPRPFLLCPKYFCGDALAGVALLHLGELLSSGVVVLEWASAPDGVRVSPDERREEPPKAGTMRGANPPRICRSPLDRSTLIDSMRPYPTATQPQFKLNHKSGGRGKCAAHGEGETPAQGGKPSAYPPSDSESRNDAMAGVQFVAKRA